MAAFNFSCSDSQFLGWKLRRDEMDGVVVQVKRNMSVIQAQSNEEEIS